MLSLRNGPATAPSHEEIEAIECASLLVEIRRAASKAEDALLELEQTLYNARYVKESGDAHDMFEAVSKIGDSVNLDFQQEPEDVQQWAEEKAA